MLTTVCCMRLDTNVAIVSWFSAIVSFLGTLICSAAISQDVFNLVETKILKIVLVAILYVFLTLFVVNVVSSVMLAVGTTKKHPLFMLLWPMKNGLLLSFLTFICIAIWTCLAVYNESYKLILIIFVIFAILVVGWYYGYLQEYPGPQGIPNICQL